MQRRAIDQGSNVRSLDAARQRRQYIALAHANDDWIQIRASFTLEGMELDDDDAERAGRLFAGVITAEQGLEEIVHELGLTDRERPTKQDG